MAIMSFLLNGLPAIGIIGYFCEIEWLIWAGGIIAIILNFFMEFHSERPKMMSLYVIVTIIIGLIYSYNADISWWFAIITVASFTYITWQLFGWMTVIIIGIIKDGANNLQEKTSTRVEGVVSDYVHISFNNYMSTVGNQIYRIVFETGLYELNEVVEGVKDIERFKKMILSWYIVETIDVSKAWLNASTTTEIKIKNALVHMFQNYEAEKYLKEIEQHNNKTPADLLKWIVDSSTKTDAVSNTMIFAILTEHNKQFLPTIANMFKYVRYIETTNEFEAKSDA